MRRAFCLIRDQPFYRRDAFFAGLTAAGYQVFNVPPARVENGDVLVTWNRYGHVQQIADRFEAEGGTVIAAENGYLNPGGGNPKFDAHEGVHGYYALALHGHNGSGKWPIGDGSRWMALGIELKPWRMDGGHILVCPNRTFGSREMEPPPNWTLDVEDLLRRATKREIRIRPHPGNSRPARTLEQDLEGAWACVIWASSAGVHALINGIPVFQTAPSWICTGAASLNLNMIEDPAMDYERREGALHRMAWAQWTVDEIARGAPFKLLLNERKLTKS